MNIFKTNLKVKSAFIIVVGLSIALIVIAFCYFQTANAKIATVLGSLFAGFIVAIIQFIIAWQDYSQTEKLKELELIKVLYTRDNRTFYEDYIKKSKRHIKMMGVTGSRFFNDFADDSKNATSNSKVLIEALQRNVKVKILLPKESYLDEYKKNDVKKVVKIVKEIKVKYPSFKLDVKYFNHVPAHSIFNVDDNCIVGPVFPELESKYTPALYLRSSSPVAYRYLQYFDVEWEKAE